MSSIVEQLPALGVGLGFRAPLATELFSNPQTVDFLEITADHYLEVPPEKKRELKRLKEQFTLIPHGLNLSIGSAEGVDSQYLDQLAALVEELDPPWWSEHLSFTRAGGIDIGHLSPLPWTQEAVDTVCANLERVRQRLKTPLILENITYLARVPGGEMTETEFLRKVVEETGVGLLLDVTNLFTNSTNHGFDAIEFLEQLPSESVVQLHFVGGSWEGDRLLDTHSAPVPPEVWELLDEVLRRFKVRGMILERDENIPPLAELAPELERARAMGREHGRWG